MIQLKKLMQHTIIKLYYYFNKNFKLDFWDTAGKRKYRSITKFFIREAIICLIVFDLTNSNSLEDVDYFYNNIPLNNNEFYFMILIGNKCDENRAITKNDIEELKKKYNIPYFEISCLNEKY